MKKLSVFLLSIFILLILSCEIGLGASVDTEAPTLEITNPPADAVIRDTFAVTGSWNDDGSISSVSLEMVRLDNNKRVSFEGTYADPPERGGKGSWQVVIDPKKAGLLDGTYEALVAINDNGGHTTTMARSFTIDNTPPVLVVSRPSTKESAKGFDNYGRSFTLEGKAADDNEVALIEVNIFENADSTVPIKTVELTNVPLTIEQDVATYEEGKSNVYSSIYGHTDANGVIQEIGDTELRYCTVTIYDGAKRYPVGGSTQTADDKRGNRTNVYYMNSEISSLLQGKYKITDLYHIKNGTYGSGANRSAEEQNVLKSLDANKVTKSKFSINPANNPKYSVTSVNVLENGKNLDLVDYQFTAGNRTLEVEITPGLDGWALEPDTIGLYLQECDTLGELVSDEIIWLILPGAEHHFESEEAKNLTLESGDGIYTQSGETYKFRTSKLIHKLNYEGVITDKYYLVKVTGHDKQGEVSGKIISDGSYAFKLVSNEEKIELLAHGVPEYISTKPEAWNVSGHEEFNVDITWTTGEGPFKVFRQIGSEIDLVDTITEPAGSSWAASETFDYNKLTKNGTVFPAAISYYLTSVNDTETHISTTATINLKYDSTTQSISNIQFTNSYEKETTVAGQTNPKITYYVRNQSDNLCTISGIATDDTGIESVTLEVPGLSQTIEPQYTSRFKFTDIDFSSISAPNVEATITSTDVAGNQITYPLDIVFDTTPPHGVHAIDASNKNLYVRIGSYDNDDIDSNNSLWNNSLDKDVGGKYGTGTFGNATTIQIRGNFDDGNDGSGVAKIYYKVYETEQLLSSDPQVAANQLETIKADVLASPTGKFAPLATAETRRVFYNVTDPDDEEQTFGGTQFTTTPNSKGYYKYYKNIVSTFNETLSGFKEGVNYLVFVSEDKVGNAAVDSALVKINGTDTTFINYALNVDKTPPSDITTLSNSGIIYTKGGENVKLWGTVSDKTTTKDAEGKMIAAGLKSFVLSRDGVNTTVTAVLREVRTEEDEEGNPADSEELQTKAAADSTLRIWEADVTSLIPNESRTISISATATDAAGTGNTTPGVVATITIDKDPPTVLFAEDSPKDADSSTAGIQVNGIISLTGTSDDANGIEELTGLYYKVYTGNTLPAAPASNTVITDSGLDGWYPVSATKSGTSNWKFTNINTKKLDGTNSIEDCSKVCFTVAVKDKAGNIGYSEVCPVVVDQDTDRPVIHLTSLPLTYKDDNNQTQKMTSENPVWFNRSELTGTVDDDDGSVEYVKVIAKNVTDSEPSDTEWENAANTYRNGIWSYTIPSNGSKKIYFQVKDKNGNIFTSNAQSTTETSYGPKIQDTDSYKFGYKGSDSTADDILYIKVDTDDPILDEMYYYTSASLVENPETSIPGYDESTQTPGWKVAESSIIPDKFGGTNKYLYIKCKTHDTNGISSVSFKFGTIEPLDGKTVAIPSAAGQENYKDIITCFNIKDDTNPVESGLTKLEINIKDNAAASTGYSGISKYYEVIVDNTDPEISFSNYTKGTQVYGSSAVTLRGTSSDSSKVEKVEYVLSKTGNKAPETGWIEITDETKPTYTSKLGWQIVFDGKTPENDSSFSDSSSYHADLLKKTLFSLYNVSAAQQAAYDTTQKIYIWVRATDELGNCGSNIVKANEDGFYLDVIPNGDKPAIDITYPSNGASVGGSIRITGTTDIQDTSASVKYVYLQIDPSYDEAAGFNENGWASELQTLMNAKGVTSYEIKDLTGVTVEGTTTDLGTEIGKGIPSLGNSKLNWYLIINGNKELNEKIGNNNRKIAIRVFAVSSTGKVSKSEVCVCEIDPEAPTFGQKEALRFVQYTDNTFSTESASRTFENGVYLTGQWYLVGSVEDDSGIRQITLGDHNIVWTTGTGDTETLHDDGSDRAIIQTSSPSAASKFKNYKLRIPVGDTTSDSFGKIDYEISVTDGSDSQTGNTLKFTIYYDNKAPEFEAKLGNGKALADGGKIYQSNGSYTVQGSFKEASSGTNNQSGFKRIAMFFTRERTVNGVKSLYLIDSMIASGTDATDNFVKLASIGNGGTLTYETNVSKANGLYWRKVNGTLENSNELSLTDNTYITNKTIRAGGLCMIDNVIYRITRITGTKIILEGTIADFSTARPVYFAYAQIIDNLSQESGKTSLYSSNDTTTNQDGDCMVEGVQFSSGEYNWNASIDSSNMLDGNVTMSFVGYDAAGNYTEQSWNQKISNNAPRIAGVIFGTDIDLNGEVTDNEIIKTYAGAFTGQTNVHDGNEYNGQDTEGNWITEYTIPVTLTVKGAVKVKPMIVGGNTALGWQYTYKTKTGTTQSTGVTQYAGVGHSNDGSVRASDLSIGISLKDFLTINVAEGNQNLKFTIWDKTDGSTLGVEATGSAKAEIYLPVNIIIADSDAPTALLSPFYWKNADDNSIYQNNPGNGHIELENELPDNFTNGGAGEKDRDAKVSGKISFDGVATDNVIVEKIKAIIPGYNGGNEFVIAQRNASATETDGWTSNITLNAGTEDEQIVNHMYYKKGEEVKANASLTGASAVAWVFELISDEYDANGKNIVTFRFHFNTEEISTKAATNVSIKFTAMDKGSPTLVADNTDPDGDGSNKKVSYGNAKSSTPGDTSTVSGAPTGCYKVDIVPYITKVYTNLANLKTGNWSVYNRTAFGHYPVAADETIELYGFNLGDETRKPKYGNTELDAPVDGKISFSVSNAAASGPLEITVNSVPTLNNKNNKNAKGSYAGTTSSATGDKNIYANYYNRQPNGDNNNLLTDDIILDVWEIDPTAVRSKVGGIVQPVMAIDPVNHNIGFAFVNGTAYFSMPYGTNSKSVTPNSYEYWIGGLDEWNSISLAYDINGYTYGTAAGGDLNTSKNGVDIYRFTTSRWDGKGSLTTEGYKDLNNQFGLEYIGEREYFYDESQSKWADFTNFSKSRIKSPSLCTVASKDDTSKATVYLAYYDSINDEVRFDWGVIKNKKDDSDDVGMLKTSYDATRSSKKYSIDNTSLIAGQTINKPISTTPTYASSSVTTTDGKLVYGGEFVSIAALPDQGTNDDAVVAVWWDGTHHKMLYSYNKTPKSIQKGKYKQVDTKWSKPEELFPQEVGEYCKVTVDADNGVHIAAYDSTNGDIWYAYLENYDSPEDAKTGCLDSNGFIGSELNIDVAMINEEPVPYVSYYASSAGKPKIARWKGAKLSDVESVAGAESDTFTSNWEISYIPTSSKLIIDHINVGVWKDDDGAIIASTTGTKSFQAGSGSTVNSYGTVWGNGTTNPVLGYAIKDGSLGYIETAQMK